MSKEEQNMWENIDKFGPVGPSPPVAINSHLGEHNTLIEIYSGGGGLYFIHRDDLDWSFNISWYDTDDEVPIRTCHVSLSLEKAVNVMKVLAENKDLLEDIQIAIDYRDPIKPKIQF